MGAVRATACGAILLAVLAVAGCGSSGSGSGSGSTPGGSTAASKSPSMLANGIKGERPGQEAASRLHLSAADCAALAKLAEGRLGKKLARASTPAPPLSRCRLDGPGVQVNASLDTGFAAAKRYENRIVETVQFNTQNPAGLPQPVPGVGEKSYMNSSASWIPALGSLLAVRGNRWLTVTIAVRGAPDRRLRAEAAALARAGFKLSAAG